jgi:hypothetical protein
LISDNPAFIYSGDPNYCDKVMWNFAQVVTTGFWLVMAMLLVGAVAKVHRFFRGDGSVKVKLHKIAVV